MMAAQGPTKQWPGASSTGSKHDLEVTLLHPQGVRFTTIGANGKRHAGVFVSYQFAREIARFIESRGQGE